MILCLAVGAAGGALAVRGCARSEDGPSVAAVAAERDPADPDVHRSWPDGFVGIVLASQTADLAPNVEGRLAEVRANLGDTVEAAAVLAVLDVGVADRRVEEARAALEMARAQERTAAIDLRAAQRQVDQLPALAAAIPAEEAANIRFAAERAQASLAHAEAEVAARTHQLEGLRATASEAVVTAPFAGRIAARFLDPGVLVGPHTPVVQLEASTFRVRFAMPPDALSAIALERPVTVKLADPERTLTATVDRVSPTMSAASGLIFVEANLDPAAGLLVSGQPARVWLR